jgi:hypothetical protein
MNESPDPLEMELAALRPRDVSPGLRGRIARRLSEGPTPEQQRPRWFALSAALAAACVVAAVFWRVGGRQVERHQNTVVAPPLPRAGANSSAPTLLAYERALARSPEELEAKMSAFRWPVQDDSPVARRTPTPATVVD